MKVMLALHGVSIKVTLTMISRKVVSLIMTHKINIQLLENGSMEDIFTHTSITGKKNV